MAAGRGWVTAKTPEAINNAISEDFAYLAEVAGPTRPSWNLKSEPALSHREDSA